jgi:membrane protein
VGSSLATTVVALLSIEVAVIILLLGAQVIAEFDRRNTGSRQVLSTPGVRMDPTPHRLRPPADGAPRKDR